MNVDGVNVDIEGKLAQHINRPYAGLHVSHRIRPPD